MYTCMFRCRVMSLRVLFSCDFQKRKLINIQQLFEWFIEIEMAKCHENVKAVQRAWQEEFHNKNWSDKRSVVHTINSKVSSRVMNVFRSHLTALLVKEGGHFEPLHQ
ncbi:hypothetical protein AVEN_7093-1 [Araneus ventricosus]|uniref:DUF4817 domain-containing protein n=1 Tax=Araneus ventricosus TaxID=182803 RepID=A0A4Y2NYA5_ARAVE|nr:hypothetical protein AVEN_7093-1 [Araneus ventricosus]